MSRNMLDQETSPYLLQHKDNPVHWRPWGPDALAAARAEKKPILLSVGYAACHWCHVMAHESFENKEIAELMNDLFINIKVDREERPDLDALYQGALHMMGEHGGWPLTMFLSPDGEPFWGGTYFPPEPRYGRPGFAQALQAVSDAFHAGGAKIPANIKALKTALIQKAKLPKGPGMDMDLIERTAQTALRIVDPHSGGTLGAPKFPQAPFLGFLWRAFRRTGSPLYREAVTLSLDRMCQGGIYDHLGGGFARYATDAEWLVPHFEKMLYDNALLVELLLEAWRATGSPLYAERIRETIDWTLRDLRISIGDGFALAASFDADSEGEEGAYYVWKEAEIDALLGDESPVFKAAYDVSDYGNWEGKVILNRTAQPEFGGPAHEEALARHRAILLKARGERTPPGRDDKVLADWNAMMVSALARAGAAFGRSDWIEAATALFANLVETLEDKDGRLRHSWCAGRTGPAGMLDDYAHMARAALALHQVTGEGLEKAVAYAKAAESHFADPDGGYFMTASDANDLIARVKSVSDQAVPSGNAIMAEVLVRLHLATNDDGRRARAEDLLNSFSSESSEAMINRATAMNAYEMLHDAVQLVIVGESEAPKMGSLSQGAFEAAPDRVVVCHAGPPTDGKDPIDGAPTAYLCRRGTCQAPTTDANALRRALAEL